jgi:hypothetical protein
LRARRGKCKPLSKQIGNFVDLKKSSLRLKVTTPFKSSGEKCNNSKQVVIIGRLTITVPVLFHSILKYIQKVPLFLFLSSVQSINRVFLYFSERPSTPRRRARNFSSLNPWPSKLTQHITCNHPRPETWFLCEQRKLSN